MVSSEERKNKNMKNENELLLRLSKTLTSISATSRKKGIDIVNRYIIKNNDSITRIQMLKLWKGLYYSMWLSDKVLIQREIAVNIAQLQRKFNKIELWLSFIEEFYLMMRFRWDGIDHYRMDKFTFLQRTMLAESLDIISKRDFDDDYTRALFNVFFNCLFVEGNNEDKNLENNKRKYSIINDSDTQDDECIKSLKKGNSTVKNFTGIGISLIFCKQFPQEFVYLLYERYKLINNENSIQDYENNSPIDSLLYNYSIFINNVIESCKTHTTLTEYIHSHLILKLIDSDLLLDEVLKDIEDLNLTQEEKESINNFIKKNIVKLIVLIQANISKLSKFKNNFINQTQRNRIYNTLEKLEDFLNKNQKDISINLLKTSRNKMKSIHNKQKLSEDQTKRVRFDMSKNVRMLLPDSISTSRVLMKIFDKRNDNKTNNELNCVLFKSKSRQELPHNNFDKCDINDSNSNMDNDSDNLRSIEIVSAEEALSKPSESNSSPSKGILRRRETLS